MFKLESSDYNSLELPMACVFFLCINMFLNEYNWLIFQLFLLCLKRVLMNVHQLFALYQDSPIALFLNHANYCPI